MSVTVVSHLRSVVHSHGVFLFQAEDGIRDLTVTGVQTCALPILPGSEMKSSLKPLTSSFGGVGPESETPREAAEALMILGVDREVSPQLARDLVEGGRSEERRVGKEGRYRWSPYHLKKKK